MNTSRIIGIQITPKLVHPVSLAKSLFTTKQTCNKQAASLAIMRYFVNTIMLDYEPWCPMENIFKSLMGHDIQAPLSCSTSHGNGFNSFPPRATYMHQ